MAGGNKKMALFFIGVFLIAIAIVGAIWSYFFVFHGNHPLKQDQVKIGGTVFDVEIANTMVERANGLSFRPDLGDGTGMLFLFDSPGVLHFWMKDMNFPIDMIWIAGDKVAGFAENAAPEPGTALWNLKVYNSPDGSDKVLEVNAGTVAKDKVKVGDTVQIGPGVI